MVGCARCSLLPDAQLLASGTGGSWVWIYRKQWAEGNRLPLLNGWGHSLGGIGFNEGLGEGREAATWELFFSMHPLARTPELDVGFDR